MKPVTPLRVATVALALSGVRLANAGAPDVEMTIEVSDGFVQTFNPVGTANANGSYNYAGMVFSVGWIVQYNFNVDADASVLGPAFISSGYTADNNTQAPLEFSLKAVATVEPVASPTYLGSAAFSVTGFNPVLATPGPGTSLWKASIDGTDVASLFDFPFLVTGDFGSDAVEQQLAPGNAADVNESLGIRVHFELGAITEMSMTGAFAVEGAGGCEPPTVECTADLGNPCDDDSSSDDSSSDDSSSDDGLLGADDDGSSDDCNSDDDNSDDGSGGDSHASQSLGGHRAAYAIANDDDDSGGGHPHGVCEGEIGWIAESPSSCDLTVEAVIDVGCEEIPVEQGQLIELSCGSDDDEGSGGHHAVLADGGDDDSSSGESECTYEFDEGVLVIVSDSAVLRVVVTDEDGNEASCELDLCDECGDDDDSSDGGGHHALASTRGFGEIPHAAAQGAGGCPGDLDGDAFVDADDALVLLSIWGARHHGAADLDGDGFVGRADLLRLTESWGPCPSRGGKPGIFLRKRPTRRAR